MKLHPPFIISARLLPALRVADATISLAEIEMHGATETATFIVDFDDGTSYQDEELHSARGGFRSRVEAFESFLGFMYACGESFPDGENAGIFPAHVAAWCAENHSDIGLEMWNLCEEGTDMPRHNLIED